ncbi:MAG: hypothetical protein CL610_20660 [Anaerolineaceae bacterium]|nr:hypothetical protein [Anaerolineaceae bacterium]
MDDSTFQNILDECLDAVLSGERTIADCLALYPDAADELQPALQVGLLTSKLKKPAMSSGSVDALEMRLRGQMQAARKPVTPAWYAPLSRVAAMLALVFLLALGTGGTAVAASANSLPGDTLYGVKRLWETIILALSSLFDSADDVWLHLAQMRLEEAEDLAEQGLLYRNVLIDLYESTAKAMVLADEQTAPQVLAFLTTAETRLLNLPTTAATEPVRRDLLMLVVPPPDHVLRLPAANRPPSLDGVVMTLTSSPTPTSTATPTLIPTATATHTSTRLFNEPQPVTQPPSPTATSRVPATATDTPIPSPTRRPTITPTRTPTATWTALPLPVLPTVQEAEEGSSSIIRPSATPEPPALNPTVRYRDTQAAVYATQTRQAQVTEEAQP